MTSFGQWFSTEKLIPSGTIMRWELRCRAGISGQYYHIEVSSSVCSVRWTPTMFTHLFNLTRTSLERKKVKSPFHVHPLWHLTHSILSFFFRLFPSLHFLLEMKWISALCWLQESTLLWSRQHSWAHAFSALLCIFIQYTKCATGGQFLQATAEMERNSL